MKEKLEEVKKFEEGNLKNKELEIECEKANLQLENMKIMHREMLERNQCLQSAMKAFESPKEYKDLVVEMEGLKIQNQQFQSNNGIFLKNNEILSDDLRKCIEKNKSLENELEIIQNEFAQEKITTEKYSKILNTLKYDLLKESEIVNLLNEKKILAKNCEDLSKYYSNLLKETQKGLKGANETYYQDLIRVLETRVNELVDKKL